MSQGPIKCGICLEEMDLSHIDSVCQLQCKHQFCTKCIVQWITQSPGNCPLCRQNPDMNKVRSNWSPSHFFHVVFILFYLSFVNIVLWLIQYTITFNNNFITSLSSQRYTIMIINIAYSLILSFYVHFQAMGNYDWMIEFSDRHEQFIKSYVLYLRIIFIFNILSVLSVHSLPLLNLVFYICTSLITIYMKREWDIFSENVITSIYYREK